MRKSSTASLDITTHHADRTWSSTLSIRNPIGTGCALRVFLLKSATAAWLLAHARNLPHPSPPP